MNIHNALFLLINILYIHLNDLYDMRKLKSVLDY
jgi:hypothetical protein